MEDFQPTVLPGPQTRGEAFGCNYLQIFFIPSQIVLCSEQFVLNKRLNIFPP